MTEARLTELELAANAHPGNRSSALIHELVAEVRRLQKRSTKRSGFVPPELETVAAFFKEGQVFNGKADDAAASFIDYFEAQGWRLSNGIKMVSWEAAARRFEHSEKRRRSAPTMSRSAVEPRL